MLTLMRRASRRHTTAWFRGVVPILTIIALLPAPVSARQHGHRRGSLDWRIDAILRASGAEHGFWGIEVAELPKGKILYRRNTDHLFLPASNLKLFTTAAALQTLGPDFVFRTTVESETPPDPQGRVQDLYLVGRGDPNLGSRVLPYRYQQPQKGLTATAGSQPPADPLLLKVARVVSRRTIRAVPAGTGAGLWAASIVASNEQGSSIHAFMGTSKIRSFLLTLDQVCRGYKRRTVHGEPAEIRGQRGWPNGQVPDAEIALTIMSAVAFR